MAILTELEAANALGYISTDEMPERVNTLLSAIDKFIETATGKDWGAETTIDPTARMLASVLLVRWFEDPGMVGKVSDAGVLGLVGQLHAKALQEKQAVAT